jgi:hypothetical protein
MIAGPRFGRTSFQHEESALSGAFLLEQQWEDSKV